MPEYLIRVSENTLMQISKREAEELKAQFPEIEIIIWESDK